MTQAQTQILNLIAQLPLQERRDLIEHFYDVNLFGASIYDRLSAEQRAALDESIAQADRGQVVSSEQVFDDLARKYGFNRA